MSSNGIGNRATAALGRYGPITGAALVLLILIIAGLSRVGCANHHTPPGHEGYIKSNPIVGQAEFLGTQRGPTSTGWVWRQEVTNIDYRPRTFSEDMRILTKNQLELKFRAHARIKLRIRSEEEGAGSIRVVVEDLGGKDWYENFVQKEFQRAVRDRVQKLAPFEVKDRMREIGGQVLEEMQEEFKDTPIEFRSVDIGDIEYPPVVVKSVINKFVTFQDNQRRDIERKIQEKKIEIGAAEAEGTADAQKIVRTTLDPMFLQYEALKAIQTLVGSPNTTFLITPFSEEGNAPMIMSLDSK